MSLSPQWLDELRARITLSSVISRTTRLTKAGHEFKACCPFHNEKSPSFTVNDQKGFYHCFGCGAHGDAIRWMTDQLGLGFMDAVKELASEAGMEVPAPDPRAAQRAEQQAGLHDVLSAAQDWYRAQLETPEGARAHEYLASRRFDALTMERFGFGYAPGGRQALKAALKQFPEGMLIEAGLRIAVDDKEPYDRFRERLTMPIHDARGRVIGFAARILDAEKKDAPKYINSPDTPLFDKGRTLFNLHRAGPASRSAKRIVVVEGQMDVIALAAAGIAEAVAPMGTALTERQLEMLWRLIEVPILCFDGDSAGQRAAMRAAARALPMLRPAHSLRIVRLPSGMDPDDLIKRDGVAALEALLAAPIGLLDLVWEHERDALPLTSPEDKAGLKARLMAHVDTIQDRDIQALYRRELLARFSEFAFPARDWSKFGGKISDINHARKKSDFFGRLEGLRDERYKAANVSWTARQRHLHRRLGAAVTAGVLRFPEMIRNFAEQIFLMPEPDPRLLLITESSLEVETLEKGYFETILERNGMQSPKPAEWDHLRFPFAWPPSDPERAWAVLEKAMKLYANLPALRTIAAAANIQAEADLSDFTFLEQQRLRERVKALEGELRIMDAA